MNFHPSRLSAGFVLFFVVTMQVTAQDFTGGVSGVVLDASRLDPLPGVNIVVVESPSTGTSTGPEGTFTIEPLHVGTYSLRVSCIGYSTQVVTNVVIVTGRKTPVKVKLSETIIEGEEVTVEASYFTRMLDVSPLSVNGLDRAEVRRAPGAIQDVQRAVQALPGVASSTDNINELIVRGGAPFENLTVMDHMEIPSINHYSNQLNSAGPINMVNADMIEDVQFFAGGFPVQYGDKSSSVMNLTVREGNRSVGLSSNTGFTMAGVGGLLEGGFAGGSGSYIVSARNSLLEILDNIAGLSSLSLTAVPRYWDAQGKMVYDLSPHQKVTFNLLYGESRINIEGDPDERDELRRNVTDSSSVERVYPTTKQIVGGVSLQTLWGKDGYSVATVYGVGTYGDNNVYEDFFYRQRGSEGDVLTATKLNSRPVFTNIARESFLAAKFEAFYQALPRHELMFGAQVQTALHWRNQVWVEGDTSRFDFDRNGVFETGPVIIPQWNYAKNIPFGGASKYYLYASDRYHLSPDFSLTLGVRYDHFTYTGSGNLSPRVALSYQFSSSGSRVSLALGRYPQSQPFPFLSDRRDIGYNRNLKNMVADHVVVGIDHILGTGLKLSLEGYYKRYSNVAVSEDFIYSADETFWSDRYLTIGRRRSYGLEMFIEKKQVTDLFGSLSLSLSRTEDADPRIPPAVSWYPSDYDYPVILTLIGGHVVKGIRSWLDDLPVFLRYPLYILPFSDEVEFSLKYRYQSGRPYTPKEFVRWKQFREGGVKWSAGAWIDSDRVNAARYPDYSRLDIQWISRFYLEHWNVNVYIALQNVLDTKNVFFENYRSDGTVEQVYQFRFFPVAGVEVEF